MSAFLDIDDIKSGVSVRRVDWPDTSSIVVDDVMSDVIFGVTNTGHLGCWSLHDNWVLADPGFTMKERK